MTMPVASARRDLKWCEMMLMDGRKVRPSPRPIPTPCERKTCDGGEYRDGYVCAGVTDLVVLVLVA